MQAPFPELLVGSLPIAHVGSVIPANARFCQHNSGRVGLGSMGSPSLMAQSE